MRILLQNRKTQAEQILVAPAPMTFAETVAFVRSNCTSDWRIVESWQADLSNAIDDLQAALAAAQTSIAH